MPTITPDMYDEHAVNGRRYFEEAARELEIEDLDPVEIEELDDGDLKEGHRESRVGGHIAHHNLKRLTREETAERRERSERFLKQPVERVPAEEEPGVDTSTNPSS